MDEDRQVQLQELNVLKSIFLKDEIEVILKEDNEDIQVILWAHITLPEDYSVKYKENLDAEKYSYINISYLPPIKLHLTLPESYPSKCSPKFTISCQWLPKSLISKLCEQLDNLWCENEYMEIIYIWVHFLKNELLEFLDISKELDLTELYFHHLRYIQYKEKLPDQRDEEIDIEENKVNFDSCNSEVGSSGCVEKYKEQRMTNIANQRNDSKNKTFRTSIYYNTNFKDHKFESEPENIVHSTCDQRACLNLNLKTSPLNLLLKYNTERKNLDFEREIFMCNICYTDNPGINCTKFENCNHIFCKNCTSKYFAVQINDGTVHPMKCPAYKCSGDATPIQVKSLVSPELFTKYDTLLLQCALDSLEHVIYCPRTFCQYPTTKDSEENLAICPNCQYVFCIFCKMVNHGIEPCRFKSEEKLLLIEKYVNGSKEVQEELQLRYGAKNIQALVNNSLSETWIDGNCKNCPRCNVSIEKSKGCNKMVCWKCSTYFCWLCSEILDRENPYSHYSDTNSVCVNKLFYLTPLVEDELDDYNSDDEQWRDWDWV